MVTLRYAVGGVRKRRGHTECATGMSFFFFFSPFHLLLFERVDLRFLLFGPLPRETSIFQIDLYIH